MNFLLLNTIHVLFKKNLMTRLAIQEREQKRRFLVQKHHSKRHSLSLQLQNLRKTKQLSAGQESQVAGQASVGAKIFQIQLLFQKFSRNSSKIRLKNRCSVTGRPAGFFRDFGLSRHLVREMALLGKLPGVTKASW
jgi:small subunit ribosomal protein S14